MKKTLLIFAIILFVNNIFAQKTAPQIIWEQTYGSPGKDEALDIVETIDDGYVVAGYSKYLKKLDVSGNFWVFKIDSTGYLTWERKYGQAKADIATCIVENKTYTYSVAGYTYSRGLGSRDLWLLEINTLGAPQWHKTYGATGKDAANDLVALKDGGYLTCGYKKHGSHSYDFWALKINKFGTVLWERVFDNRSEDIANKIIEDYDSGYMICGNTRSTEDAKWDGWLIKLSSKGNKVWDKKYGGSEDDEISGIVPTSDSCHVICGSTKSKGNGLFDFWALKIDNKGEVIWEKTFGGIHDDKANSIYATNDGGYVMAGYTESKGSGQGDFWVVKIDKNGELLWDKAIGGKEYDVAYTVLQTTSGKYVISGGTYSKGAGGWDAWIVKLAAD